MMTDNRPKTTRSAFKLMMNPNLTLISVDGLYASYEANTALDEGCNVMIVSSNITLDEEIYLKKKALGKGLLMLGPDSGGSIINGKGIGFANCVRRGGIGVAGTGSAAMQAASVIIDKESLGVSQALCSGSRDLSAAVGGIMTENILNRLSDDPETKVILILANPPNKVAADKIIDLAGTFKKPVAACFIGHIAEKEIPKNVFLTKTIEEAALFACALYKKERLELVQFKIEKNLRMINKFSEEKVNAANHSSRHLRAFYSGSSFAYEAVFTLKDKIGDIYSNLKGAKPLMGYSKSTGNTVIDLSDYELTKGKTNPFIDHIDKCERIKKEADSEDTAVILFDVILGYAAHPNPSEYLAPAIKSAKYNLIARGRDVTFIAYICGTDNDPQNYAKQEKALNDEGVITLPTNSACLKLAGSIIEKLKKIKTGIN